jgi:hypothetical protein
MMKEGAAESGQKPDSKKRYLKIARALCPQMPAKANIRAGRRQGPT